MNDDRDMQLVFAAMAFFAALLICKTISTTHDWQKCLLHPATIACQHHH
jgi:hypothetical protein